MAVHGYVPDFDPWLSFSISVLLTRLFGPTNKIIPVLPSPSLDCVTSMSEVAAATTVMYPSTTDEFVLSIMGRVRDTNAYD